MTEPQQLQTNDWVRFATGSEGKVIQAGPLAVFVKISELGGKPIMVCCQPSSVTKISPIGSIPKLPPISVLSS